MDRQYIRDHEVIERYLSGALTANEEQAFEEAYLGDPELLDQVQAAERLREGIKELDGAGRLERARPPARWRQWLASPQYAVAASVLLAVSLGFSTVLYRDNGRLRETTFSSPSPLTRLIPLVSTRGASQNTIPAPSADEWIVFQLDAGVTRYESYRAALVRRADEGSSEIWSNSNLTPVRDEIAVGLPGRSLRPGEYEVRLEGRAGDGAADRFEEVSRTLFTIVPRN